MFKTMNRHFAEIIMILTELLLSILLITQMPQFVEMITVGVGLLSMSCGVYCLIRYYRTTPTYMRYDPELARGIMLLFAGFAIATMQLWFSVIYTHPAIAFGLTLLTVAMFKIAILVDVMNSPYAYLLACPTISTILNLVISLVALFNPLLKIPYFWEIAGALMIITLLIDTCEIRSSEAKKRESWSMQILCWM